MITRIEIDGFKTFKDFAIDLAPFQVIVGMNNVGKSNFLDAIRFLSYLTSSFNLTFEGPKNIEFPFTILPNNTQENEMRFAVEILTSKKVSDTQEEVSLRTNRFRYDLKLRAGNKYLIITSESLTSIPYEEDSWARKYNLSSQNGWLVENIEQAPLNFISSKTEENEVYLTLHKDGSASERTEKSKKKEKLFLGEATTIEFPHALAVKQEMEHWITFHLNPLELREYRHSIWMPLPGDFYLINNLFKIYQQDKSLIKSVSKDFVNLVSGISAILIQPDVKGEPGVYIQTTDNRLFSSNLLSDGSLRMLAIATLANDPAFEGLLAIEEPENNVHPAILGKLAKLLKGMATDFNDPEQKDFPLRQVFVTTHSPVFMSQPEVIDALLYTSMVTHIEGKNASPIRVTRMNPVKPRNQLTEGEEKMGYYTLNQIEQYLSHKSFDEALAQLKV